MRTGKPASTTAHSPVRIQSILTATALLLAGNTIACQARAKLIITDISSDARAIDVSIWKHKRIPNSNDFELIPSEPSTIFTFNQGTQRYRILTEIEHNVEYSIFAASFVPKPGSDSEICLRDVSARLELNGVGLLEAIADVSLPLHPVRNDMQYPSSACTTRPSAQGVWPSRKPLIAQISMSSNSQINDTGAPMPTGMDMGMGAPMDMAMGMGGSMDMGTSCSNAMNGPTPPPGTLLIDGWLFDPSSTIRITNASDERCAPLLDTTPPAQIDASRLVLPLSAEQVATLRGVRALLTVANPAGQSSSVQTVL